MLNCILAFLFFVGSSSFAVGNFADENGQIRLIQPRLPIVKFTPNDIGSWNEDVRDAVVKISNTIAPVWGGGLSGGHGTGFIVAIREVTNPSGETEVKLVIFTNKHVVQRPRMFAQKLMVKFNVRGTRLDVIARPEEVSAKLVYASEVLDFAVLEVNLSDIKRAKPKIIPAAFPGSEEYEFIPNSVRLRGTPTTAVGFPGDGDSVFTAGQITGLWTNPYLGSYIQTDTPINPGNSGGPFISLATGRILGINSMTVPGRDGTHYVLPIKEIWEEYDVCEACHNGELNRSKFLMADFVSIGDLNLQYMGIKPYIELVLPNYFDYFESLLKVSRADKSSGLVSGDLILKIEGEEFPPTIFEFRKRLQRLVGKIHFTVFREGRVLEVESKIHDSSFYEKRREVDFVYLSGLFLQDSSARHRHFARPNEAPEKVYVSMTDSNNQQYIPPIPPGSFVTGLRYESQRDQLIPIKSLFDLKQALKAIPAQDRSVILQYHSAVTTISGGRLIVPPDSMSGYPAVRPNPEEMPVLLTRVITPENFSVAKFLKKFDPKNPTVDWNWQNNVVGAVNRCKAFLDSKNPS